MMFKCIDSDDGSCGRKFDQVFEYKCSATLTMCEDGIAVLTTNFLASPHAAFELPKSYANGMLRESVES